MICTWERCTIRQLEGARNRRVLSVRGIHGVVTRCCRDTRVGGRVFRVLAGVSGIGGECFSWMGGGQQCGDRVAAHLDAGHVGGNTRQR
jgi:hypothetical protein